MNALILVDVQNDFLPGGALAVPHGDEVIAPCNALMRQFDLVVATQDWHPPGHGSFASAHPGAAVGEMRTLAGLPQVMWPDHCIQGTRGAALASALDAPRITRVFTKGEDPGIDSYSGFFDNDHRRSTGLAEWLTSAGITHVCVVGLATDYCVKATALDAIRAGFSVTVDLAACRGVDLRPGDVDRAIEEMRSHGVLLRA